MPSFEVAIPWWQEAGPVVDGARVRFGLEVTILRLLTAERDRPHGGAVTYMAEVDPAAPAVIASRFEPWAGSLDDDPHRAPWARPGGPAADLRWAQGVLAGRGMARGGPARQIRSWNLSSLWKLPLADGSSAWLKAVPPFFAHEGAMLERLAGGPVPGLIGRDRHRILMPELPGEDQYDAVRPVLDRMIDTLVELQAAWVGRESELLELGLPDWRGPALSAAIADVVERHAREMSIGDVEALHEFLDTLPGRFGAVAACGIADTLVHGDFHPGNVRADGDRITLLDWGDCGLGHPLLDEAAFLDRVPPGDVDGLRALWHERWRDALPGSDPKRASRLLAPVAAARQAVIYRRFLDGIEPSEHPYHRADVPDWLKRTAAILREG